VATRTRITLGGIPIALRSGRDVFSWALTNGVGPAQAEFVTTLDRLERILAIGRLNRASKGAGPLELRIETNRGDDLRVPGLYAMSLGPSDEPLNTASLLVSDQRILWARKVLARSYNLRRRTGNRRWLDGDNVPLAIAGNEADVVYKRATLDDGKPWTAARMIEDVMDALVGADGTVELTLSQLTDAIEGIELFDSGPDALDRALAFATGQSVYVEGATVVVHNSLDGREDLIFGLSDRPIGGAFRKVDLSAIRPEEVEILFEREIEMRFEFRTGAGLAQTTRPRRVPLREEPTLENVLPCPDPRLILADGTVVASGTWITFEEFLAAPDVAAGSGIGQLNDTVIREYFWRGMGTLKQAFRAGLPALLKWDRRLDAVGRHYRQTFRILPQWMDKVRSVKAYRIGILSPETGARGRSPVYADYTVIPSREGLAHADKRVMKTVTGYAANLRDAEIAPFSATVIDEDNGILTITPKVSLDGHQDTIMPGVVDGPFPTSIAGDPNALRAIVKVKADWQFAVILTIVPIAPRNEARLHQVFVTPGSASLRLGVDVGPSNGPVWTELSTITRARFIWDDDHGDGLKETVWSGQRPPTDPQNLPELEGAAFAQGARVYAPLLTRTQGDVTYSLLPRAAPVGTITEVIHQVDSRGVATTRIVAPPVTERPALYSLLPEDVRQTIRRLVQP